jgi:hypothetical protein
MMSAPSHVSASSSLKNSHILRRTIPKMVFSELLER